MASERHYPWCAGNQGVEHRCGLGEHRSEAITSEIPGLARLVLNRVADRTGNQYAEIRTRVRLDNSEPVARYQLRMLLSDITTTLELATAMVALPHQRGHRQ